MSDLLNRRFVDQIKVMFGWEPTKPTKPEHISPAAQKIHFYKKGNRDLIAETSCSPRSSTPRTTTPGATGAGRC